ncbi:MAG: methyltransferase domain-containing protein [Thermomicrobiales bacterium]
MTDERSHRSILRSEAALDLTSDLWMHSHFRAMAEVYHSLLNQAELLPGDRVLDLGCGSGTHFGWIAAIVGPEGRIVGVDADAENLEIARSRIAGQPWAGQIELHTGPMSSLPFEDTAFDAVWCAGSLQYVADPVSAIREMVRVVRPGGKVAVQDVEMHPMMLGPMPDELLIALKDCLPRGDTGTDEGFVDWFTGHKLRGYLLEAGLREVRGYLRMRDYVHPLTDDERRFLDVAIPYLCSTSPGIQTLRPEQQAALAALVEPAGDASILNRPDFQFVEGRALAVGVR